MTLGRDRGNPRQRGDLLRQLLDRVPVARFFGQEKDDPPRFVVRQRRAISCSCGGEIRQLRERDAVSHLGQATMQGRAECSVSGNEANRSRLSWISESGLRAWRRAAPE